MTKSASVSNRDCVYPPRRSSKLKCKRVKRGSRVVCRSGVIRDRWGGHIVSKKKESTETAKLSIEDVESFFNAIENPPEPNERVKTAMKLYQESVIDV